MRDQVPLARRFHASRPEKTSLHITPPELDANIRKVPDQLIAKEFVEPADQQSLARYKHTRKASQLFAELCVPHMARRIQSQLRLARAF
jgi:hypothetical protein